MGKIRTRNVPFLSTGPGPIMVERTAQVKGPCQRLLRETLGTKAIDFEEIILANDEVKLALSGSAIKGTAREKYSVFPLLSVAAELFWLGASIVLKRQTGSYRIKSVSLVVFKGDAIDERKTALFRAEWDSQDSPTAPIHAQPHWHVYPRLMKQLDGLDDEQEETPQGSDPYYWRETEQTEEDWQWPASANFHYAMASRWHLDQRTGTSQEDLSEIETLLNWMKGCITYSRQQLRFLHS